MAKGRKPPTSGVSGMMKQLQQVQEQLLVAQQQLADETVTSTAGGGAIKITLTGDQRCTAVEIDAGLLEDADVEMLQDLILTALNARVGRFSAVGPRSAWPARRRPGYLRAGGFMLLPEPIQDVINAFSRLPGIGPKTASRLTFFLLRDMEDLGPELANAIASLQGGIGYCEECFNITTVDRELCEICDHPERDAAVICVVEDALDVVALERTGGYPGRYHVLHGVMSPIEGVGPEDLKINALLDRVRSGGVTEVILATNPSMEGDATAMYLRQHLTPLGVRVTRLARGLPVGGDLEYADQNTLLRALSGRQEMG